MAGARPGIKTRSINIKEIPVDTHHKFKLSCMKNNITMRDALIKFMEYYGNKYSARPDGKP